MASKMKLSVKATSDLDEMANNLDLRRNVVCRIAIGVSLRDRTPPDLDDSDYGGLEFNKPTIVGTDEQVLMALLTQHFNKKIDAEDFFSTYIRAEIIRGLSIMVSDYHKINSPVEYMERLVGATGEEHLDS